MKTRNPFFVCALMLSAFFSLGLTANAAAGVNVDNIPPGQSFFVKSVLSGTEDSGYWDQSGRPETYTKGQEIKVWAKDSTFNKDQQYQFISLGRGWYNIVSVNGGGYLDVRDGVNDNGVQIQLWEKNNSISQRFRIQHEANGRFKIFTYWGRIVCLPHRKDNGTKVHTWNNMRGAWMEWYFIDSFNNQPWNPSIPPRPVAEVSPTEKPVYTLLEGEEFVYGKMGLNEDDSIKYTAMVIRKHAPDKTFYKANFDPYGHRPLGETTLRPVSNPEPENLYDYWMVFNGQKMGPYDRILEMKQDDPEIEDWISADGKGISFSGAREKMYGSVINNRRGYSFWTTNQAPFIDVKSGSQDYIVQFGPGDNRYIEEGRTKFRGWERILKFEASQGGESVLYVGSETSRSEFDVFLNHEKIDGSINTVFNMGFVPGTTVPYYSAHFHGNVTPSYTVVGSDKITAPLEGNFEKVIEGENSILITITVKDSAITAENPRNQVYYDYYVFDAQNQKVTKWPIRGTRLFHPAVINGEIYVRTVSEDGRSILFLNPQGQIITRIPIGQGNLWEAWSYSRMAADKEENIYSSIQLSDQEGSTIYRNATPLHRGFKGFAFTRFEVMPETGKLFAVFRHENSTQAFNHTVIYGDTRFTMEGRVREWIPAPEAEVVFALRQDRPDGPVQIYKNGRPLDTTWRLGGFEFVPSPDGSSYAMMDVTSPVPGLPYYRIDNSSMHRPWQLFVNSKPVSGGKGGAPVWNSSSRQFMFLQQQGREIVVESLSP